MSVQLIDAAPAVVACAGVPVAGAALVAKIVVRRMSKVSDGRATNILRLASLTVRMQNAMCTTTVSLPH